MSKLILFLLLGLSIIFPIYCQNTEGYESDLEYVMTKYLLKDYEEAIRLLNTHFSEKQNELAYLFGLCYLKLNMNKMALHYFYITLSEHSNNYELLNNIGVAYFQDNDFVNAMKYFHLSFISNTGYEIAQKNYNTAYESWALERKNESIVPIIPFTEKPTMYNSLGWFYYYSGDFHNAIYYFTKSIEEDEKYQNAYISLAYVYHEGNNFKAALDYLLKAEQINENNPDLYNNLGIVYFHLSDFTNSANAFMKAISLNNRFAEPYNNLGFLYFEKGEYTLYEEYFQKSITLNLDNQSLRAESMAGLAIVNANNNNAEQSRVYKKHSIKLNYKMNSIKHLTEKLKWSNELIEIWESIKIESL